MMMIIVSLNCYFSRRFLGVNIYIKQTDIMKNILAENMRRFGTKNLKEQSVPNTLSDDDILDIIDPDDAEEQLMAYRETGEFSNNEIEANVLRDPRWTTVNNEETSSLVYVVIPFYSDGGINENDVMVFKNYNDADNYLNGLEGSPKIIETELK